MSRLMESDIEHISASLKENDKNYRMILGCTMKEIALTALGLSAEPLHKKCAVVPVTSGLGVIGGFAETVRSILEYCGADVFITEKSDVGGVWQAYGDKADLVFMADDNVCAAFGTRGLVCSDNGYSTGIGFAAALEIMQKRSNSKTEAVVLGAGPVGKAAAEYLNKRDWRVAVYDTDSDKTLSAAKSAKIHAEDSPDCIKKYDNIICAANAGAFITANDVSPLTNISAPGMPLGVTDEARSVARVFHNPLELGIAVMYYDCAAQMEGHNHGS